MDGKGLKLSVEDGSERIGATPEISCNEPLHPPQAVLVNDKWSTMYQQLRDTTPDRRPVIVRKKAQKNQLTLF